MGGANEFPAVDLRGVASAFSDPALGSQAVFRVVLQALSRPGRVRDVPSDAQHPDGAAPAAAALLLALLDPDCALWMAPRLAAGPAGAWLRFHTGCRIVEDPARADFAWADADQLPALDVFAQGREFEPEAGATCVVQVRALTEGGGWRLRGPGILDAARLGVEGLPDDFTEQWRANSARFPRGVDLLLCAGASLAGLSRTTRVDVPGLPRKD